MNYLCRASICSAILACGIAAEAALESACRIERPSLDSSLASIPMTLGSWVGRDEPLDPDIRERAQTDDCLNRTYEHSRNPGKRVALWINYSSTGLNLRHSPDICLPSGGWEKVESATKVMTVTGPSGDPTKVSRLGYGRGDLVQGVGFWYYIFGEGRLERWVRSLPITSRSSHGRTTRGSGLTVEIFCPAEADPNGESVREFATELLKSLEPIMPRDRAAYFIP